MAAMVTGVSQKWRPSGCVRAVAILMRTRSEDEPIAEWGIHAQADAVDMRILDVCFAPPPLLVEVLVRVMRDLTRPSSSSCQLEARKTQHDWRNMDISHVYCVFNCVVCICSPLQVLVRVMGPEKPLKQQLL